MFLSRGRYIVLNNFFNNHKKLSRKFIENLDICLNCNKCKDFCPSNIDMVDISTKLKSEYKMFKIPFYIKYFLKLFFYSMRKEKPSVCKNNDSVKYTKDKVVFFQGCINKYVDSSDKNASLNIIEKLGYKVKLVSQNCCGLPFLSDGNIPLFNKNAEKIVKSVPSDVKYIVCSCDSCYETLKSIESISDKLITLDKLLEQNGYYIHDKVDVLYHRPLTRKENCYLPASVKYINKKGCCSTMENFLAFKHPNIASQLYDTVFYKKEEIQDKIVLTTCQLDKIGLKNGLKRINSNAKIYQYSEYICLLDKKI